MDKKIINKCDVKDFKTLEEISFFATDIKNRSGYDIGRLKKSIVDNGFLFPIFIWEQGNVILDGKSRYLALKELEAEGFQIEKIPVVTVSAKDETEAKEKLLQVNSRYGKITEGSLNFFAKDCAINLADLNIHLDKINFEFQEKQDAIAEAKKMVFSTPVSRPPVFEQAPSSEPLSFGGTYEPIEAGNGVNDSSIEETWVNEQHDSAEIEVPSFAEETEFGGETENVEQNQFTSPDNNFESTPEVTQFDNAVASTPSIQPQPVKEFKGVSFMCPFCYSEFTLSKEQLQEILGE